MINIPTLDEAEERILDGNESMLDLFISEHQPTAPHHALRFRNDLHAVLVDRKLWTRPTMLESLLRLLMLCVTVFFMSVGIWTSIDAFLDWMVK